MNNITKWLYSVVLGSIATFFGQYGLFLILVALAVVFDVITGLVKVKATGERLSSEKATKGFWKKIAFFVALLFGIFLDFAAVTVLLRAGVELGVDMPFALIICAYIILTESISISENLLAINPDIMPKWIIKLLRGSKEKIENKKGENENE